MDTGKIVSLLGVIFLVLLLLFNFFPRWPRIPGDLDINKFGFRIYIPFVSVIILSVLITIIFNFFGK